MKLEDLSGTEELSNVDALPVSKRSLLPLAFGLVAVVGLGSIGLYQTSFSAKKVPLSEFKRIAPLDKDAEIYSRRIRGLHENSECISVPVREFPKYNLDYLYCSNRALLENRKGRKLTENFSVSERMAQRFNFWRRVYSHFNSNISLTHVTAYPEVVLEIYDTSKQKNLGFHARRKLVRKIAKERRAYYRRLFKEMHRMRQVDFEYLPVEMQRIARLMSHINDPMKYDIARRGIRNQTGQRNYVESGIAQSAKYLDAIKKVFESVGIPSELANLAFVESSFNLRAYSKVGASGVYQIMPETGKQYLKIRHGIDERNDPIKAARAAAKVLRLGYRLTEKWPLAVTSYNHGVGSITRAVKQVGSREIEDIIDGYRHKTFGFASKNFYAEYLGMLATLLDADKLFPGVKRMDPLAYEDVRLPTAYSLRTVRQKFGLSNASIRAYNPDISRRLIRSGGILPRGYVLKVPAKK